MGQFNELLARIELALNLGDEPTQEELAELNMNNTEFNELITLNSMIENNIQLEETNTDDNIDIIRRRVLIRHYTREYLPLLEENGLAEFLPRINN